MRVAFLGMGIMGRSMAANLVKAGHEVRVWNRTAGKTVEGARWSATPREAAAGAEVVWLCVADTKAVEQVLFGKDGVEASLGKDMIVVDSSTISPAATREFAGRVRARGAEYVDAPITGSKSGAEQGTLLFIAGGPEATVAKLEPLWKAMGKQAIRVGETGKGQSAKLAMNLMIAVMYEGFAEAFTLARGLEVDVQALLELIGASMVRNGVVDYKAPFVLKRDFSPNFPLRLMHKDLHLMLDSARGLGLRLPALETVDRVYEAAAEEGHSDLDYAATLMQVEKWAEKTAAD